ncbi:hypothetical protein U9M48_012059, partial [Paspalum notatum var. saurae]
IVVSRSMASASASSAVPVRTPAGAIVVDGVLPSDLMIDIMLRLPVRPLFCLRAVCRSWRSLLSDPAFATAHASRHPAPLVAVGVTVTVRMGYYETAPEFVMLDMDGNTHWRVAMGAWSTWNPTLRPSSYATTTAARRPHAPPLFLAGPPPGSTRHSGSTMLTAGQPQLCYVLTVSGGGGGDDAASGWGERHAPPARITWSRSSDTRATIVDGIAYFLTTPPRFVVANNFGGPADSIASFDLATEQWSPALLRGPWSSGSSAADETSTSVHENDELRLAAVNGYLVVVHDNSHCDTMDLWFRVGPAQWCRRFAIRYHRSLHMDWSMDPLWELDDGRVAVWMRGCGAGGLKIYHPRTKVFQDVVKRRPEGFVVGVGVYTGGILSNYC